MQDMINVAPSFQLANRIPEGRITWLNMKELSKTTI